VAVCGLLRLRQGPMPGPTAIITALNACLQPQWRFPNGVPHCSMEFVLRLLQEFPIVPGHLVQYEERAVCPLCRQPMQQVSCNATYKRCF
jgi:hypothetical protein